MLYYWGVEGDFSAKNVTGYVLVYCCDKLFGYIKLSMHSLIEKFQRRLFRRINLKFLAVLMLFLIMIKHFSLEKVYKISRVPKLQKSENFVHLY